MYCKKCGAEINDDARYCEKCGSPTDAAPDIGGGESAAPDRAGNDGKPRKPAADPKKRRAVIALVVIAAAAFLLIFLLRGRAGSDTAGDTAYAAETETGRNRWNWSSRRNSVPVWVAGYGVSYVNKNTQVPEDTLSYAEQVDAVMASFEEFNAAHPAADFSHTVDGSYRMFQLLCVIAKETDETGSYAGLAVDAAVSRYEAMDEKAGYANLQTANGIYRSAEMLGSMIYELGGNSYTDDIGDMVISCRYAEPDTDNFPDCLGDGMAAVFEGLYSFLSLLDLPGSCAEETRLVYESWGSDMEAVENEKDRALVSYGTRRFTGSLYRVYELLDRAAPVLDGAGSYADAVQEIEEQAAGALQDWQDAVSSDGSETEREEYEYALDGALFDACVRYLEITARSLDPAVS